MNEAYINPPAKTPEHVTHRTFYSKLAEHEIGYNIYLPPSYETDGRPYPVHYHLHGWTNNESTDLWTLEHRYKNREAITVFANAAFGSDVYREPVESIIITELLPHIDRTYRTQASRKGRALSGWSMGGGGALYYAVKYRDLFSAVTAYAGTFHHYFHENHQIFETRESSAAAALYRAIMRDEKYFAQGSILYFIRRNAEQLRGRLQIELRVGSEDILFCENEIMHLFLNSQGLAHEYRTFEGVSHELHKII